MAARADLTFSLLQFMSMLNPSDPIIKEQYTAMKYPAAHEELQNYRKGCNGHTCYVKTDGSCAQTETK